MRIRKRSVPLPFSNLCPVSLSDPQLITKITPSSSSPLLHREQESKEARTSHLHQSGDLSLHHHHQLSDCSSPNQSLRSAMVVEDRPRPDLQLLITRERNCWVCSDVGEINKDAQKKKNKESEEEEEKRLRLKEKSNDLIRMGSILGAEEAEAFVPLVSSSSHQVGRWCEGEKAIPLKKRRGSFERKVGEEEEEEETIAEKMKTKMKSKTNKKCVQQDDGDDDEGDQAKDHRGKGVGSTTYNVKKRERGSVLMEGSRCSRVNGRGWRCCQQTLVGYSLCEHHLGKGRLRSMSSVRSRVPAVGKPNDNNGVGMGLRSSISSSVQDKEGHVLLDGDGYEEEEKPLMITKKRKKIGMVKARSISSLLGQTKNTSAAINHNN